MKSIYKTSLILLCSLITTSIAYAQSDLETGEVEVIKNFEAQLLETEKLKANPNLPDLDQTTPRLIYAVPSKTLTVNYLPPVLRPIAMKSEKLPTAFDIYAKAGFGYPLSPYGEVSYRKLFNENLDIGVDVFHHSANNSNQLEHQQFSYTEADLEGTYYLDQGIAVNANVGYTIDNPFFYGYDHELESFEKDNVKQSFKTFDVGTKVFNGERNQGDFNYYGAVDFYRLTDNYASSENGTDIELGATKYFAEKHPLSIVLGTDFTTFEDTIKQKLNNFYLQPTFSFHGGIFKATAGINLINNDDVFKVYPIIEASANILGNKLALFAGWRGDYQKNTFRSLSDYNPYIVSRGFDIKNTKYSEYYGGAKGSLKMVDYQVQASYKDAADLALFLPDSLDTKRFQVLYDSAKIVTIQANADFHLMKDLTLGIQLSQNIFNMANETKAWHLPAFETNISAGYTTLKDQLLLKLECYIANGVPFRTINDNPDNLNALLDISLGAEYAFARNFSAFIDLNNIANNKRQRWQNYPSFGFNVLGGVVVRF